MIGPRPIQDRRAGRPRTRRAFATFLVLWAIALVAIILAAIQSATFRDAAAGREAVARVRAKWAARAGVEAQIARLTASTLSPDTSSATSINADLAGAARGTLEGASYAVRHFDGTAEVDGPDDAHAKLNVNRLTADDLMMLDTMDEGTAESIVNWVHGVDESSASGLGADEGAYTGLRYPYKPRGAPVRSLKELELVQGVDPALLRGEDANYNGLLDPVEDDQNATLPPDNADGLLQPGWSQYLTAVSQIPTSGGYGPSGEKRIDLGTATVADIQAKLRVDSTQAQAISTYAQSGSAKLSDFVRSTLGDLAGGTLLNGQRNPVTDLSDDQLRLLLDETYIAAEAAAEGPRTGRFNINTVRRETLERFASIDATKIEALLTERDARSGGFASIADLLTVPGLQRTDVADMMAHLDVRSYVFVVTSRGRDAATGTEVEIVAVLDRSTIPVVIRDLVVR
jgi:DNA uptake protein ComE-like DNA-binding protein